MARLLVLWLLSEQPMHGYQIKRALTDGGMRFWFGLEDASIYSVLRTLSKNGHATELETEQVGNRPPRTRYRITPSGRKYYRSLLVDALATPAAPIGMIDVALAARGDLESDAVKSTLQARARALNDLETALQDGRNACPSPAIVARNLAIVRAEKQWLQDLDLTTIT